MLKVNVTSGETLTFDLGDEKDHDKWTRLQRKGEFQKQVTGIGLHVDGTLHVLPLPSRFRQVSFSGGAVRRDAEFVGEWVQCHADGVRVSLTVFAANGTRAKLVRVNVANIGRPRHVTKDGPWPQAVGKRTGTTDALLHDRSTERTRGSSRLSK